MNLREYQKLKDKLTQLERQEAKAQALLEQTIKALSKSDCKNIEQAEKLLEQKEKEIEALEVKYEKAIARFERKWNEKLG